jgi:hypothetical protein
MADSPEDVAKKAAREEAKGLIKESFDEWYADREKTRTEEAQKRKPAGGFFDSLFGA